MTVTEVLQVKCGPPDDATHTVRQLILTPDNLRKFWEHARQFKMLFTQEIRGDFKKFLEVFLRDGPNGLECNGLFWVVDDFTGVLYITDIQPGVDAKCHFSFFDKRIRGREPLVREMLIHVFTKYQFQRLSVEVALYINAKNSALLRFVEGLGFKLEGRKRSAALYEGQWFDVNLYGILRSELCNPLPRQSAAEQPQG